jgi:prevent-host-death family protein
MCYRSVMSRRITQRELRNESGRIMRALDKGHSFTVTRNGVPVGELVPIRPRAFVAAESVAAAFKGAPRIARTRFRKDVDAVICPCTRAIPAISLASRKYSTSSLVERARRER